MLYTLTSTSTLDGDSPLRMGSLVLQENAACSHHGGAGVKGFAVLTAHGDDQINVRGKR